MVQDAFFARLHEAEEAGLNKEWALKVAYLELTLDEALGEMDMYAESEFDPNFSMCGDGIIDAEDGYDCGCRGDSSCVDCIPF